MPVYEYYCKDCRKQFEALRPMSKADAPIACKQCEGKHTQPGAQRVCRAQWRQGGFWRRRWRRLRFVRWRLVLLVWGALRS